MDHNIVVILIFARSCCVQRTSAGSLDPVTGISIIVSFDDTPGLKDTKYANREWNANSMCAYSEEHYPKVSTGIPT
jgi:hypothetical protein